MWEDKQSETTGSIDCSPVSGPAPRRVEDWTRGRGAVQSVLHGLITIFLLTPPVLAGEGDTARGLLLSAAAGTRHLILNARETELAWQVKPRLFDSRLVVCIRINRT